MTTLINDFIRWITDPIYDLADDLVQEYQNNAPVVPKWYTSELAPDDESKPITVTNNNNIGDTKL